MSLAKLVKFSLVIIDVIIFLSGLIMLIAGSVVQYQINSQIVGVSTVDGYSVQSGSIICIIFGLVILLLSLFGVFSTFKNHHRFLNYYAIILSLVFIIQFITGVTGLSVRNSSKFESWIRDSVASELKTNSTNPSNRDFYQRTFKCCGWTNYTDYENADKNLEAPKSCCNSEKTCEEPVKDGALVYQNGCSKAIVNSYQTVIQVACAILVTFSMLNLMSIVLSCCLVRQIKHGYQYT